MSRPNKYRCNRSPMQVDPSFYEFSRELSRQLSEVWGERVTMRRFTKQFAGFAQEERLNDIILKRALYRRKNGGGLF